MNKRRNLLILFLFLLPFYSFAQSDRPYVVNAGAGNVEKGNFNMTYFIGDYIGYDTSSELKLVTNLGDIIIYPNPVKTILNLKTSITELWKIQIFNVNGVMVREEELLNQEVNFSGFPDGFYVMKIFDHKHEELGSVKVIKN